MPFAGVVPGRNAKVGGFSLLVSLASTGDGGLRVVPGITPSFVVSGPKADDRFKSSRGGSKVRIFNFARRLMRPG